MDVKLTGITLVDNSELSNISLPKWDKEDSLMCHMVEVLEKAASIQYGDYIWYKNIPRMNSVVKEDYEKGKISFIELLYAVVFNNYNNNQNLKTVFSFLKKFYKKEI